MCQVQRSEPAASSTGCVTPMMLMRSLPSSPVDSCADSPAHGKQKLGCVSICKQSMILAWDKMMINNAKLCLFVPT